MFDDCYNDDVEDGLIEVDYAVDDVDSYSESQSARRQSLGP